MNKNELTLETLKISAHRYTLTLNFLATSFKIAAAVGIIFIIMEGLRDIVGANPDGIKALAEVVRYLNVSTIIGYVLAAGCAGGWFLERKGKKRLLPQKAAARHKLEQHDAYHPPSGLTPTGDTPESEEN